MKVAALQSPGRSIRLYFSLGSGWRGGLTGLLQVDVACLATHDKVTCVGDGRRIMECDQQGTVPYLTHVNRPRIAL